MACDVVGVRIAVLALAGACGCGSTAPSPEPRGPVVVPPAPEPVVEPTVVLAEEQPAEPRSPFVSLRAAQGHACVLHRNGRVLCWGSNGDGQVDPSHPTTSAPPMWVEGIDDAVAIGLGMRTTCAARRDGRVVCWGMNDDGQLGRGTRGVHRGLAEVVGVTDAVDVIGWTSALTMCARRRGGAIVCWGRHSQVEENGRPYEDLTVRPYFLDEVREIVRSGPEVCVSRTSGEVLCWATSSLGPGPTTPTPRSELTGALSLYGGESAIYAALPGGETRSWSAASNPPAGLMSTPEDPHPVRPALRGAIAFGQVGWNGIFGLLPDGTVVTIDDQGARLPVPGAEDIVAIATSEHLVGLTRRGEILEWGRPTPVAPPTRLAIPLRDRAPEAPPTGTIPAACTVRVRRAIVEHYATVHDVARPLLRRDVAADAELGRALCSSAGLDWESPDCPVSGPWPGRVPFEVVVVRRSEAGGYDVVRRLGEHSNGTETASLVRRLELRGRDPIVVAIEEVRMEQTCDGEGDDLTCGMSDSGRFARVLVERLDGSLVLVEVRYALPEGEALATTAPTATPEGPGMRVVACGGSALVPLEEGPP